MNAPQNGPVPAPGAAGASSTNTIGIRRKRVLEDFEPHMLLNGGGERLLSDADQQLRGTYHSLPTDFFADVHNGFQTNHMMKSRRLGGDISHEDFHAAILGPLHRDVLAPLTGSGSPGPGLMSEPLQKANPFLPNSATIASFSTSQLDGFRLDGNVIEQKENKARVTKPFAKRSLHGTPMGTPKIQPPHLPMLSQFLSPTDPGRPGSTGPTAATLVSGSVPKQTPFTANDNSVFQGWRPSASQVAARQVGTGGSSLPSTPAMPTDTVEPVRNEVGFAFEVNPDQCSSDEEFSMENEISLSQDKLNSLSVHDISDHLLGADSTHKVPAPWLVMELDKAFASTLNEREERELKEIGVYTLTLGAEEEVILGRDHFFTVFGEKIRGAETFHLSRKHCVFHVSPCQSADSSKQLKIVVENTSTNGLDVNGQALKNKERKELHVGDTITLLKIKDHRGNIPLAYKLLEKRDVPLQGNGSTKIWESSSRKSPRVVRSRGSSKANSTRQPKSVRSSESSSSKSLPPKKKLKFPKLHVEILIADPFVSATDNSEEQSRGYRDELAAVLAAFSSVRRLRSNYECATKDALFGALKNPGKVVIYAGGSESNRLLIEDNTGMPTFISVSELAQTFGNEAIKAPLVVVFATSVSTAQLFVDSGFQHVIFLNSSSASQPKAARYLKALLAGFLQGSSVEDAHVVARRTALGLSSMAPTPSECLCGILPGGRSHNIAVGDFRSKPDSSRMPEMNLATLNALLIPSLPTYFIPREEVVGEVITALRKENAQVCILRGGMGVGKSSTAVYVAKYATDRRWYKGGVYYFSVVSAFANVDNDTAALGWTEDSFDSNEKRNEISGRIQQDIDELLQLLHPKNTSDAGQAILVVLDGCDRLNLVEFRDFLVKMVRAYPGVQFVLTMTQVMKINCYNKVVEECTVHLKELAPGDAANVFLSMAKFFLTSKRLEEALPSDSAEELAQHPALCRLDGNPSLISRLVLGLRTSNLDEFE